MWCFLWCHQIGGGSLRIYKREVQQKVLEIVGISPEEVSALLRCIWACGEMTIMSTVYHHLLLIFLMYLAY